MNAVPKVRDAPTDVIRDAILRPLSDFNASQGYPASPQPLAITLDSADGKIVGGLWGKTVYDWLFVDDLFVPASMRGQDLGASLLSRADEIALARGCVGSCLTTFTFQARGFYEKRGYDVFGSLDNCPGDNTRFLLRKRLKAE